MYRIFIADDEAIIREGIKCLLDYEALGFTICGEAANGDKALEGLLSLGPDVALMDIRMPGLSGLEAIKAARDAGYTGKIVIISSYTDFKYAQEAIRYGVQHYLTKPIDEDELAEILKECAAVLAEEARNRQSTHQYRESLRAAALDALVQGGPIPSAGQLEELGLTADCYQAVALDRVPGDDLSLLDSDRTLRDYVLRARGDVLILKGQTAIHRFRELLEFHLRARHGAGEFPLFAWGQPVTEARELSRSCEQAMILRGRRFFCLPEQYILTVQDLPDPSRSGPALSDELVASYAATLLSCIQSFNRRKTAETLQALQQMLTQSGESVRSVRLFLTDLYLQVREQMSLLYPGSDIPFFTNRSIIHTIQDARYLYEIIRFLSQRFEVFMDATGAASRDSVLDDILHYIHHNYASNITLENIAPLFGYNRSYLGKIFTKKMGQNFNSYVDHVRIERSKELLIRDSAKVYSIAERVGYKNVDYFHIKFKKYVGMSPAEYRKKYKDPPGSPEENNEKDPLF